MFDFFNGKNTGMMPIWEFLDLKKPDWAKTPIMVNLDFWVTGKYDTYKMMFIGNRHPKLFAEYMRTAPDKYKCIPGVDGLMCELMDMSIQYNLYKVSISLDGFGVCKYKVWLSPVEPEQDHNIDADMVERFCNKVFEK